MAFSQRIYNKITEAYWKELTLHDSEDIEPDRIVAECVEDPS